MKTQYGERTVTQLSNSNHKNKMKKSNLKFNMLELNYRLHSQHDLKSK